MESLTKTYVPILVKLLGDSNFKVALISLKILDFYKIFKELMEKKLNLIIILILKKFLKKNKN